VDTIAFRAPAPVAARPRAEFPLADCNPPGRAMEAKIALVIPCYKVKRHILSVVAGVGPEVDWIVAVDDACPERTGEHLRANCKDTRLTVLTHGENQGVGAAVLTGYAHAARLGADIIARIDGDGQMDPKRIPQAVRPILAGQADYTKGNRFYRLEDLAGMPWVRLIGNTGLSLFTKMSSGYWGVFDPANGFTAIHRKVYELLPVGRIARRYFFESDMLFHLSIVRAKVVDIPMPAIYGDEVSNLSVFGSLFGFFFRNVGNVVRRIFYSYFLRDFTLATLELLLGLGLIGWGVGFGVLKWIHSGRTNVDATAGTVMLAALPIILGIQLLLAFLAYDFSNQPAEAIHPRL
jgi:glycosyltransferase involved in cell wall biosynthesis